jgi:hypothetical protein
MSEYSSTFNILRITSYITNHLCNQWWMTKHRHTCDIDINNTSNSAAAVLQTGFWAERPH